MSNNMRWIGIIATFVILVIFPLYAFIEPGQQDDLVNQYRSYAVESATGLYAENCVVCHGASGEGIADNPALNSDALRGMSENDLIKIISRGRDNTLMAAWAVEEGGVFSNSQVQDLIAFIQYVNWGYVEVRVSELGLMPPQVVEMDVTDEMLAVLDVLPEGDVLSSGLMVFAENCAACHGTNGAGSVIAPALDSAELRLSSREDLLKIISSGVPGTLMAGWQNMLPPDLLDNVIDLIYRWPDLVEAGIDFPEAETLQIISTPKMIEDGGRLFNIACKSCHGIDAYGSPMAPALNNQLFLSETPDAAVYQIIAGGLPETLMPAWGSRLNDYDIQSLVVYLRSFEPSAPPILPPIINQ
ncbi:c-type cytochrome [Chloroflexota bacterium]